MILEILAVQRPVLSGDAGQRLLPAMAKFGQNQRQPFPNDIRHASGGDCAHLFGRLILPLFQLNLRLYHDIILAYLAIMSTTAIPYRPPPFNPA